MKKMAVFAVVAVFTVSLRAADTGKSESSAASSSSSSSHSGGGSSGGGSSSAASESHSTGGGGGGSAPVFQHGGSGPGETGGGHPSEPGGGHPGFPGFHPGGFFEHREYDHDHEIRARDRQIYNNSGGPFEPDTISQGTPPRHRQLPVYDHPDNVLPSPSLPNPDAATLAALAHDKPILGARWSPATTHPRWDKALEYTWQGRHYRWYAGGWLVVDDSFWPPDNYSYQQPLFITSGVDSLVADVQSKLHDLCYYHGTIDGDPGPTTREAIARYQRYKGLPATGAINKPLLLMLGLG